MTYLGESTDAIGNSVDVTRLSVGPELKRHFDTKSGASVEPFAFFKSSLDLGDASFAEPVARNTLGAGVSLIKPENSTSAPRPTTLRARTVQPRWPPPARCR